MATTTANPFLALSLIVERERQELEQQFREKANNVEEEEDEDDDQHDESAIPSTLATTFALSASTA